MSIRDSINYAGLARHCAWLQALREWIERRNTEVLKTEAAVPAVARPEISIGSKWTLRSNGDPFPSKYPPAEILDVKDGWVRYSMGPPTMSLFPDNRREIDSFLQIYEPCD